MRAPIMPSSRQKCPTLGTAKTSLVVQKCLTFSFPGIIMPCAERVWGMFRETNSLCDQRTMLSGCLVLLYLGCTTWLQTPCNAYQKPHVKKKKKKDTKEGSTESQTKVEFMGKCGGGKGTGTRNRKSGFEQALSCCRDLLYLPSM